MLTLVPSQLLDRIDGYQAGFFCAIIKPVIPSTIIAERTIMLEAHINEDSLTIEPACYDDLDGLVALRIDAMRPSLERIGRFDPQRARERFASGFEPANTYHVLYAGERIGFFAIKQQADGMALEHLYIAPRWQGRGIGAFILQHVLSRADAQCLPVRVGALLASESNRFYLRHGFVLVETGEFDNYYVRMPKHNST